jgi:uncharacterized protein (DUF486 family)
MRNSAAGLWPIMAVVDVRPKTRHFTAGPFVPRPDVTLYDGYHSAADGQRQPESAMPTTIVSPYLLPILMLIGSNVFMTVAWYGHLRFKAVPLAGVILASWGIALIEYCLAVPANRWGSAVYTTAQLKTIQEIITLLVFAVFTVIYLREPFTWNYAIGFVFIAAGAYFIFDGPFRT